MNILVTGAKGFIGKHMCLLLKKYEHNVFEFDRDSTDEELVDYINKSDFVIHLAGINRPLTKEEFYDGNTNFTKKLVDYVKNSGKNLPIIMSSSIQAEQDNDYGKSKKQAEDLLLNSGLPVYVYRLCNVFGKWCRPNYNSVCATWCYNISHNIPIQINDPNVVIHFNYVEDICNEFLSVVLSPEKTGYKDILYVQPIYNCSLGRLSKLLYHFKENIEGEMNLPYVNDMFELNLLETYCDYASDEGYTFNFAEDERGFFKEIYKSQKYGQISINMSYPGVLKGGHYHKYKKEKFLTVIGNTETRVRDIDGTEIQSFKTTDEKTVLVNIEPCYTHDIRTTSDVPSYTLMWISEVYSPETADTYKENVEYGKN